MCEQQPTSVDINISLNELNQPIVKERYGYNLLRELFPGSDINQQQAAIMNKVIFDYRSYGLLTPPEGLNNLYYQTGVTYGPALAESIALSDGMVPYLEKSGYTPIYCFDISKMSQINNVCGYEGGDYTLRAFELALAAQLDGQFRLVRVNGDEYAIFAQKEAVFDEKIVADAATRLGVFSSSLPVWAEHREIKLGPLGIHSDTTLKDTLSADSTKRSRPQQQRQQNNLGLSPELAECLAVQQFDSLLGLKGVYKTPYHMEMAMAGHREGRLYISISGLKEINDIYGKAVGNEFIKDRFTRIKAIVGTNTAFARQGASFVVCLNEVPSDIETLMSRLQKVCEGAFEGVSALDDNNLNIYAGISYQDKPITPIDKMIKSGIERARQSEAESRLIRLFEAKAEITTEKDSYELLLGEVIEYLNHASRAKARKIELERAYHAAIFILNSQGNAEEVIKIAGEVYNDIFKLSENS